MSDIDHYWKEVKGKWILGGLDESLQVEFVDYFHDDGTADMGLQMEQFEQPLLIKKGYHYTDPFTVKTPSGDVIQLEYESYDGNVFIRIPPNKKRQRLRRPGSVQLTKEGGSYAKALLGCWGHSGMWPEYMGGTGLRYQIVPVEVDGGFAPGLKMNAHKIVPLRYRPSWPSKPYELDSYDWWAVDAPEPEITLFFGTPSYNHGKKRTVVQLRDGGLQETVWMAPEHTWEAQQTADERMWMERIRMIVEPEKTLYPDDRAEADKLLPWLFLGSSSHARALRSAAGDGDPITALVNAAAYSRGERRVGDIDELDIDAEDSQSADKTCNVLDEYLPQLCQFLDRIEQEGRRALVYCVLGRNRSALLCAGYLIKSKRWPLLCAVDHCFSRRSGILGNWHFRHQLIQLAESEGLLGPSDPPSVRVGERCRSPTGEVDVVVGYLPDGKPQFPSSRVPSGPTGFTPEVPEDPKHNEQIPTTLYVQGDSRFQGVYVVQPKSKERLWWRRVTTSDGGGSVTTSDCLIWTEGRWGLSTSVELETCILHSEAIRADNPDPSRAGQWYEGGDKVNVTVLRGDQILSVDGQGLSNRATKCLGRYIPDPKRMARGKWVHEDDEVGIVLDSKDDAWQFSDGEPDPPLYSSYHRGDPPWDSMVWRDALGDEVKLTVSRVLPPGDPPFPIATPASPSAKRSAPTSGEVQKVLDLILHSQDTDYYGTYDDALKEIRAGEKRGCWIWWIWPHLYALRSGGQYPELKLPTAQSHRDYLRNDKLAGRLLEITGEVLRVVSKGSSVDYIFGSWDASKFRETVVCFAVAAAAEEDLSALELLTNTVDKTGGFEPRAAREIARQTASDPEMEGYGLHVAKKGAKGASLLAMCRAVKDGKALSAAAEEMEPSEHASAFKPKVSVEVLKVDGIPSELVGKKGEVESVEGEEVIISVEGGSKERVKRGALLLMEEEKKSYYGSSSTAPASTIINVSNKKTTVTPLSHVDPEGRPRKALSSAPCDAVVVALGQARAEMSLLSENLGKVEAGTRVRVLELQRTTSGDTLRALVEGDKVPGKRCWMSVTRSITVILSELTPELRKEFGIDASSAETTL
eukprot:Hpha_TRINITY_DN16303_c2_g19::TRINITY_DN16303_c2_g19_i1::g.61848::m.61848